MTGEGEPEFNAGRPGDLYVSIQVNDHAIFERDGNDVRYSMPINLVQAVLGASVTIPTLEGESDLEVPAGTQTGATFRLKGRGVPLLGTNRRGDQLIDIRVKIPQSLSEEQRHLFNELGKTFGDDEDGINRRDKRWYDKFKDAFGGVE